MNNRWDTFANFHISHISVSDVLDVLIVTLVIYWLFVLLKGTRAARTAAGIGFLIAFYFVAKATHLRTSQWFLTTFFNYAVFGIIVIYQAEIRKILANIGSLWFFRALISTQFVVALDDIVLAAMSLSCKRAGALIVIERHVGLKSYMENGIRLDALLSYDLLVTLFQPETPMHDGAVIVQKGKVAASSCFLPLTLEPQLSKEYGTRHRAAIGITEETDAVAIVVSEETGRISVAVEGNLNRFHETDALIQFLQQCLNPQSPQSKRGWSRFRREGSKP